MEWNRNSFPSFSKYLAIYILIKKDEKIPKLPKTNESLRQVTALRGDEKKCIAGRDALLKFKHQECASSVSALFPGHRLAL